jgi:hypothetical protein
MVEGDLKWGKICLPIFFLILFIPFISESAYGECTPKSYDELTAFSLNIPGYTMGEKLISDRFIQGSFLALNMEVTFIKHLESVKIQILNYGNEDDAASDATVFPTFTDSEDWVVTTFRGHPTYQSTTQILSSEYMDYAVEWRVVDECIVVRGVWKEKIRVVEPLVTIEDGVTSVELVVGAVVDEIDGRTGVYIEPIIINDTPAEDNKTSTKPDGHTLVVLANSIDTSLSTEVFSLIKEWGIDIIHSSTEDFDQYKNEKIVLILGGPDATEGVGEKVQGVLSLVQEDSIREEGARRMFTKPDVWASDQRVFIIAGSDRHQTKKSLEENWEDVATEVIK